MRSGFSSPTLEIAWMTCFRTFARLDRGAGAAGLEGGVWASTPWGSPITRSRIAIARSSKAGRIDRGLSAWSELKSIAD